MKKTTFPLHPKEITLEANLLAQQAHGAVTAKMGNSVILATVVEKKEDKPGSFLPLSVEFRENFASAGIVPGNYHRRESKLSEHEILVSRLIDRSIRPLFPKSYFNTIQVQVTLLSHDKDVDVSHLAVFATSAALSISPLPFLGPVANVRVAQKDGELHIDPTPSELEQSPINISVAGTQDRLLMLEGSSQEIDAAKLVEIIAFAKTYIEKKCQCQRDFMRALNIAPIDPLYAQEQPKSELQQHLHNKLYKAFYELADQSITTKKSRSEAFRKVVEEALQSLKQQEEVVEEEHMLENYIADIKRAAIRQFIIDKKQRIDGRGVDEIRPIDINIDYLPSTHGSAIFTRGCTQVLATVTLGGPTDVQRLDGVSVKGQKKFILHYNFPGFCTGDVKPNRGPARREIGHGYLAEKSLHIVLPETPYTIRLTAETMSSDGSSSMASVCAGSLALMDAGVQISKPVAGIAMGFIHDDKNNESIILSDINSEEDACGNVDLKITGTKDGITACQMDIKDTGISFDTFEKILAQARVGLDHVLGKMNAVIYEPNNQLKSHVPIIQEFSIKTSMMGTVIGPRGKTIQTMQEQTGATIQLTDEGTVTILAPNIEASTKAYEAIQSLVAEPEIDKVYKGKIKSLTQYGAFIEFLPQKEGLLHVSEMGQGRIEDPSKLFEIGQEIEVKLISITKPKDRQGRTKFGLSIKGF